MKNRLPWLDNVKMVAMLAIILGHSYSYLHGETIVGSSLVQNVLISFAIPLFMFVAGVTSFKSATRCSTLQELVEYLEKITIRLGVPDFLFTSLTGLIQNVFDADILRGGTFGLADFLRIDNDISSEK